MTKALYADGARGSEPQAMLECAGCGLLQSLPVPHAKLIRRCGRCGTSFGHGVTRNISACAMIIAGLVMFLVANFAPLMSIEVGGRSQTVELASGVGGLAAHDLAPLAAFVLAISVLAPLGRILAMAAVLILLNNGAPRPILAGLHRAADYMRPWAMLDVFLVGTLVALTKLHDIASVSVGAGLYALIGLVLAMAVFDTLIDRRAIWDMLSPPSAMTDDCTKGRCISCTSCGLLQAPAPRCRRCREHLHRRKPQSLSRTSALVLRGSA